MERHNLSFSALAAVVGLGLLSAMPVAAQPTPAQLEMLRSLSPEQREALARQYGLSPAPAPRVVPEPEQEEAPSEAAPPEPEPRPAARGEEPNARELAWCKREQRLGRGAARRDGERAAKALGFENLDAVPLPEECGVLLRQAQEKDFNLGRSDLPAFGYDFFTSGRRGAVGTNLPVPDDYTIGPGDTIDVQLFGKENAQYALVVSREGQLSFPGLGPLSVAGLRFDALQRLIQQRVAQQMVGVQVSVTMGPLRSIRVFVVGEAVRPGNYTVSSLATLTQALYASGGVRPTGSLRDIQLKRDGKVVRRLDLYDLLLAGDTRDDIRLQSGDAVFIPPVGATVSIEGEVLRPARYEIGPGATLGEVIDIAGGLTPDAYPQSALLERIDAARNRTVLDLDLTRNGQLGLKLASGDHVQVSSVLDKLENVVRVVGHVHRPRFAAWREGLRLTDLLPDVGLLRSKADLEYVLIRRELAPNREITVLSANLAEALRAPGGEHDVLLQPRDQVFTFGIDADRVLDVRAILTELRAQARRGRPARVISVAGSVRAPGEYPLEEGMRVRDLLRAAGQLAENAALVEAELTRFEVTDGSSREVTHQVVDLSAILNGNAEANIELRPYDQLNVRPIANWNDGIETVEILGEVRYPGSYAVKKGETYESVLRRAGGFTEYAFLEGALLTRLELQRREQEQLDRLAERLSRELTAVSLEKSQSNEDSAEALRVGEQVAAEVRGLRAIGRLVIDLGAVAAGKDEVIARAGDRLVVPRQTQEVTVIGEVQAATSHLYEAGASRQSYINRSGGFTIKADKKRVFVVRANGQVDSGSASNSIRPGDTIVAPLDTERMRPLVFWSTISQIVYQIALTAASAKTVGAL